MSKIGLQNNHVFGALFGLFGSLLRALKGFLGGPRASPKAQQPLKHLPKGVQEDRKEVQKGSENVVMLEIRFRRDF